MRHLNRNLFLTSLALTALTVGAAQLGSAKGSAVFGRPLDLSVQVRLDSPIEDAANCFSAEVFQADNKFDAGRIRLDVTPAANGLDATVRVRSSTTVSEPWAKVILRSNCGAKVSRQYDFLTDFATDIPTSSSLAVTSPVQPLTNAVNVADTTINSNDMVQAPISNWNVNRQQTRAKQTLQKTDAQIAQAATTPKKTKSAIPSTVAPVTTKQTTAIVTDAVGQSRLKMETFELTDEHQVLLKLSSALVAPTGIRTPEEIQALAQATAVWRAINGMPAAAKAVEPVATQGVAATTTPAPTLQAPPATVPVTANQKLAGKSEFSNLMVYGLIGLLALTLACIAWLWLRVRKASRAGYGWLSDSENDEAIFDHEPTQFLHSNFRVDGNMTKELDIAKETIEPSFDVDTKADDEPKTISKETAYTEEVFEEDFEDVKSMVATLPLTTPKEKSVTQTIPQTPIVSAMPPHFDDPRFDERVLRTKKKNRDIPHEEPIESSEKLMELVLADTPPKLRSVSASSLDEIDKSNKDAPPKTSSTSVKDDAKGNLIDFDIFAEPEPLNKPTRFIR
jgi:hypothetical protein